MKTLKMLVLALFTAFLGMSAASAADIQMTMSASPANPIKGQEVTFTVTTLYGDTSPSAHTFVWNSSEPNETPALYNWTAPYPYSSTKVMKFRYLTSGTKSITVTATSGNQEITRTLSLMVYEGRITLITPNGGECWQVGKTYLIWYRTEGNVNNVQFAMLDDRYPSEVGNAGMLLITQSTSNAGYYPFTVPQPSPTGISNGNIGGRNYKISVTTADNLPVFGDISASKFTIRR